jgi:hypothetical protein
LGSAQDVPPPVVGAPGVANHLVCACADSIAIRIDTRVRVFLFIEGKTITAAKDEAGWFVLIYNSGQHLIIHKLKRPQFSLKAFVV